LRRAKRAANPPVWRFHPRRQGGRLTRQDRTGTGSADVAKKAKHSIGIVRAPAQAPKRPIPAPANRRPASPAARAGVAKPASAAAPAATSVPRQDDGTITALKLPAGQLSPAMRAYFEKCQEKLGFIPNVLAAYAFDNAKLEAFAAMYNDL